MIYKSNNNSYHYGTNAFFDIFFEKDPHLNSVEYDMQSRLKKVTDQEKSKKYVIVEIEISINENA